MTAQIPTANTLIERKLEQVFEDPQYQLVGVAVSATGRLFVSYPIWSNVHQFTVVEVLSDGTVKPYPNAEMNSWKNGDDGLMKWVSAQAVYVDDQDALWVVDPAAPMFGEVYRESDKLVRVNLATNAVERVYRMKGATDATSKINDVRVDTTRHVAYLTNSSEGGIVVVDLSSGRLRQVLKGHPSTQPEPTYRLTYKGRQLPVGSVPLRGYSDGLALSPDRDWLYFKPIGDDKLYRIATSDLRNPLLTDAELGPRVQDLGHVLTTDGMEFDDEGNLYFGDLEHDSIVKITIDDVHQPNTKATPSVKKELLVHDERLAWPDSYSISKDGYLYVSVSQLPTLPAFNDGVDARTHPCAVYRVKIRH